VLNVLLWNSSQRSRLSENVSPGGGQREDSLQLFYFVLNFILTLRMCFMGFSCSGIFPAHYEFLSLTVLTETLQALGVGS
jgi:hypothetical protein